MKSDIKAGRNNMKIYTIGFTKKNAESFFSLLSKNNITTLVDVRLNNVSQLAGYTKKDDLKFFLKIISNIKYIHSVQLAPTKQILDDYKQKKISWDTYESKYIKLLNERKIADLFKNLVDLKEENVCLLCSEPEATFCHRRLLAEYLKNNSSDKIQIIHL